MVSLDKCSDIADSNAADLYTKNVFQVKQTTTIKVFKMITRINQRNNKRFNNQDYYFS